MVAADKKALNSRGLFASWLISYVLILLIAFIFILSGYMLLSRNLREESIRAHRAHMQQSQLSMDYLLGEVRMIISEIIGLPEMQSLGGFEGELGARQYYLKKELRDELQKMHASHPAIETVFLYFWPGDYVVSSYAAYEAEYYHEIKYSLSELDSAQWREAILTKGDGIRTFLLNQRNTSDSNVSNLIDAVPHIQFVKTGLYMFDPDKTRVSICLTIRESVIRELVGAREPDAAFFAINRENALFLDDRQILAFEFPDYDWFAANIDVDTIIDDQILTVFPSKELDWLFISFSPQSVVEARLTRLRWMFLGLMLFFWLFGAWASLMLARRNYRPLTRLMDFVSGSKEDADLVHFRRTEYRFIEKAFERLREEKASVQDQLALQQETIRLNFLARLLQGKLKQTTHSLEEQCEYQGFFFEEDAFIIVILKMEETVLNDDQLAQERGALWLASRIRSVITAYSSGDGWVCEINNLSVLFINLQSPSDDPQLILPELLGELKSRLLRETGITYTIGASRYCDDLAATPIAYEEAQEALDFRMVRGKGAIITCYDVHEQESREGSFNSLNWERRFLNLFTAGRFKEAGDAILDYLDNLEHVPNLGKLRMRLFGVMSLFLGAAGELFDESFILELDCERRLLACTTLNETRREIRQLFDEIGKHASGKGESLLRERVTAIIEENYRDPNLSVGFIAEELNLSISNFSWLFKEETGAGPLDCIHRTRLREAKRLLVESDASVKEVAAGCGYLSDIAFIRVFKKYEGVTPGQFRQQVQHVLS